MKQWERWGLIGLLTTAWLVGGIAPDKDFVVVAGAVMGGWWLLWAFMVKRTVLFPRYFGWFCGLVVVAALSIIWSSERVMTLRHVVLLASGALWWVGMRTFSSVKGVELVVKRSVLIAGVVFTGLWILHTIGVTTWTYKASSLVAEASTYKNHNHLGDWWMVILVMSGGMQWIFPGIVMLWASRSRSADLGVMAGWGYLVWSGDWWKRHRRLVIVGGVLLAGLFVGSGLQKSTLGARDYYIQAIAGWKNNPIGVGFGNFGTISLDPANHWWGRKDFSSIVHNLPLEWVAGMGWLGLIGWVWLGLVSWKMGTYQDAPYGASQGRKTPLRDTRTWRAVYWALLINFCFDTTYFVPSMWWLWLVVLGLAEGED